MGEKLILSTLPKTWILDLDGTILKHNGYILEGEDTVLDGAAEFLRRLPNGDRIVLFTSRTEDYRQMTLDFLAEQKIRYDEILFNMPMGERIVINDRKPSGIDMAFAVNMDRDKFEIPDIIRET